MKTRHTFQIYSVVDDAATLARDLSRRIRGDDAALAERMANAARPD